MPRQTKINFQRRHFEWLADNLGSMFSHPSDIVQFAEKLAETNDQFNQSKFEQRCIAVWEDAHNIEQQAEEAAMQAEYENMCIYGSAKHAG